MNKPYVPELDLLVRKMDKQEMIKALEEIKNRHANIRFHIWIKNKLTNEVREITPEFDFVEYMWSEGNFECDCNRHLLFRQALDPDFFEEFNCGDEVYSIVDVQLPDGTRNEEMIRFLKNLKT